MFQATHLAQCQIRSQRRAGKDLRIAAQLATLCARIWSAGSLAGSERYRSKHRSCCKSSKCIERGVCCAIIRTMEQEGESSTSAAVATSSAQSDHSTRGKSRGKRRSDEKKQSCRSQSSVYGEQLMKLILQPQQISGRSGHPRGCHRDQMIST